MVVKNGEKDEFKPSPYVLDKKKLNKKGELTAPIKKGEKVGVLTAQYKGMTSFRFC